MRDQRVKSNCLKIVLLAACACIGCGGNGVRMGYVEGSVTLDGQPVKEAVIRFTSKEQRGARGRVVDGEIVELTTFEVNDGVPVGDHRVTVQESYRGMPAGSPNPAVRLPKQYSNVVWTPLTATVERGSNEFTFELVSGE